MKRALHIAIASALITTAPALAKETGAASGTRLVRTADLDLGTKAGQRKLYRRLAHAARDVCGTVSDANVEGRNEVRKCRAETLAKAKVRRQLVVAAGRGAIAVAAKR